MTVREKAERQKDRKDRYNESERESRWTEGQKRQTE